MVWMILALLAAGALAQDGDDIGKRPYEMEWAGRTEDDTPPLVDFEDLSGWTVESENAEASFAASREQQLWGKYVGKLTYRGTGGSPTVRILPPEPIAIPQAFDAVSLWVYGNNWFGRDPSTPQVTVTLLFSDAQGVEFSISLMAVRWQEWFLLHRRLTSEQIKRVEGGGTLKAIIVTNGRNTEDRFIYLDNLAAFTEKFEPLEFEPRPERGIPMFPGQGSGTNTGPGKLPFPNRLETICPANLTDEFTNELAQDGAAFTFTYQGADGTLTYRLEPKAGTWSDISAGWSGYAQTIRPCNDGGVYLWAGGKAVPPEKAEHLGTVRKADAVESRWRLSAGDVSAEVTYAYRIWGKSLVIDTIARGGNVAEVRFGYATGLRDPRLVTNPFYTYSATRPAVAISGSSDSPLFLTGHIDWYLSNASTPWAENQVKDDQVRYSGGARYINKTDGVRNDCYERFFITMSPRYEEVLPTIANPVSPWKHITGTKLWRPHGAGNRESDRAYWKRCHRYGMTQVVVTDHETMWRDGGESFTFRTKAAPGKGGDQAAADYSRYMQDELGFTYGPYNNFTDFAPVNEFWSYDMVNRLPDNQLQHAWTRCYAPKPARAVEYCAKLAPKLQEKYQFSTAYCDVHTAVAPWTRVDYDPRVPGAGTFAAVYYAYGEIMLLQKAAWNGPVYSEGNNHFSYCGLTDGNYGQDQRYRPADNPWLVDFDLRKMHDLCCNFGMGMPSMFYGREYNYGRTPLEIDASYDRFFAATVAFGHPGYLTFDGGYKNALRSYYMLQQLHSRYCLSSADEIRYASAAGELQDTSTAVASGAYRLSQVVTRYEDGTITAVNGSRDRRMKVAAHGRAIDLPPNGYMGWTEDGDIEVISADQNGHRCDYSATPAHLFVDGRDKFMRFDKAAGNGIGICRNLPDGRAEIIPYAGAECGFAIDAVTATALDFDEKELGPASIRQARGLSYVMPVEGAFSYIVETKDAPPAPDAGLTCHRDEVVPGERLVVHGAAEHDLQIPLDAKAGDRIWRQFEDQWIDFTVVPLAYADVSLSGNVLKASLSSNLAHPADFDVTVGEQTEAVRLEPGVAGAVSFDLGEPVQEETLVLAIEVRAGELATTIERGMSIEQGHPELLDVPDNYEVGRAMRGETETSDFGDTRANAYVAKYHGGVGYTFAIYDPIRVPVDMPAAFRASVGKGDGSDRGDGILYKIAIVDEEGNQTVAATRVVIEHEWADIEADLTPWAGQDVRIKIISDVGEDDNSSGDWAAWADMRIDALRPQLVRRLETGPAERHGGPAAL